MIIWGMVGNSHDASLAVFVDNKLAWASLSKDFSDVPNDPDFNWTQLEVAKQSYGLPDKVIWYERPFLKTLRQFAAGQGWLAKENNISELSIGMSGDYKEALFFKPAYIRLGTILFGKRN